MKKFFLFFLFIFIFAAKLNAQEIGKSATLFIPTFDGKNFDLKNEIGKIVIINFWSGWCSNCRKEMTILNEIHSKYSSKNLKIIGINIDKKREREKALQLANLVNYQNSMLIDAEETNLKEPNQLPLNYVINKEGKIMAIVSNIEEITDDLIF